MKIPIRLIDEIKSGSIPAQEELYQSLTTGQVYHWVCRQFDSEFAKDLCHEAFLSILKSIKEDKIRNSEGFNTFTYATLRNLINTGIATRMKDRKHDTYADPNVFNRLKFTKTPLSILEYKERVAILHEKIKLLHGLDRVIIERILDGEDPKDVQASLNLNTSQFANRKSRAVAALRELVV